MKIVDERNKNTHDVSISQMAPGEIFEKRYNDSLSLMMVILLPTNMIKEGKVAAVYLSSGVVEILDKRISVYPKTNTKFVIEIETETETKNGI